MSVDFLSILEEEKRGHIHNPQFLSQFRQIDIINQQTGERHIALDIQTHLIKSGGSGADFEVLGKGKDGWVDVDAWLRPLY